MSTKSWHSSTLYEISYVNSQFKKEEEAKCEARASRWLVQWRFNANLSCATVRVGRLIGRPPLSQHTSTREESVYWRKYVRLVAIRNVSASCYWAFLGVRITSHTKQVEKRQTGCTAGWKHGLFGAVHYVIHIVLIPSSSFFVLFFQASCYGFTPWATSGSMPGAGTVVQRPRPAQVRLRRMREK